MEDRVHNIVVLKFKRISEKKGYLRDNGIRWDCEYYTSERALELGDQTTKEKDLKLYLGRISCRGFTVSEQNRALLRT